MAVATSAVARAFSGPVMGLGRLVAAAGTARHYGCLLLKERQAASHWRRRVQQRRRLAHLVERLLVAVAPAEPARCRDVDLAAGQLLDPREQRAVGVRVQRLVQE